ncbi:MAG: ferredoxin family protein [Devosia sp.]|nr:ferredoxin family protein [Devosia sp.]
MTALLLTRVATASLVLSGSRLGDTVAYVIAEPCIGTKDASCVAVCPVDCIYEGEDQYYINPDECIDCGACEPECPVEGIFADDSVPEQWTSYTAKNKMFFGA